MFFKKKKTKTDADSLNELFGKVRELKEKYEILIEQLKDKNRAADELLARLKSITESDDGK